MQTLAGNVTSTTESTPQWISGFTYIIFVILIIACAVLQYLLRASESKRSTASNLHFLKFQQKYFLVYFLALFGDWLQGPYIYKLYSYYGFVNSQIAALYIMGFMASMTFGTWTGVFADYFGRKKMCMSFCITYSLCCLTKLSSSYGVLMLGRLLGGISTSLLFSVFESWYVYEHVQKYDFPKEWISITFSQATFWNGILAINAGIAANFTAEFLGFGPVSPFILAVPCFLSCCLVMYNSWEENYGKKLGTSKRKVCLDGLRVILSNPVILILGVIQSFFESVMYIFVFLWTPVLDVGDPPLGMIFSVFMVCIMIGSSLYQLLCEQQIIPHQLLMLAVVLATVSMGGCALAATYKVIKYSLSYAGFLLMELAVGIYFPAIGFLKSQFIPESHRANIMNWFRLPLNLITSFVLLWLHSNSAASGTCYIFTFCTAMMTLCIALMLRLSHIIPPGYMTVDEIVA